MITRYFIFFRWARSFSARHKNWVFPVLINLYSRENSLSSCWIGMENVNRTQVILTPWETFRTFLWYSRFYQTHSNLLPKNQFPLEWSYFLGGIELAVTYGGTKIDELRIAMEPPWTQYWHLVSLNSS